MAKSLSISASVDDARRLFHHAQGFQRAEQILLNQALLDMGPNGLISKGDTEQMAFMSPAIVICSIRQEFLLKVLLILDHGEYPKSHKLDELFDGLKPVTKKRVRDQYMVLSGDDDSISKHRPTFDKNIESVLEMSRNSFVKYRYFPTSAFTDLEGFVSSDVSEAALFVIGEDHPEWWT